MRFIRKTLTAGFMLTAFLAAGLLIDHQYCGARLINRLKANPLLRRELWAIGICEGDSPFNVTLRKGNPILRARDITDTAARMVADPFAIHTNGLWHLFFEIDSISTRQGEIGLATSRDLRQWEYRQIVLDEPFHLSFPQVFFDNGICYMIPESYKANAIRLYRADPFPTGWRFVANLVEGPHKDSAILHHEGRWWIFSCTGQNENMNIFYADRLTGPWSAHSKNPVIQNDRSRARAGGRIFKLDGRLIRIAQDCSVRYGQRVMAYEIKVLTPDSYSEKALRENPILEPDGHGWNAHRMHHLDPHQLPDGRWIGFTDGNPY